MELKAPNATGSQCDFGLILLNPINGIESLCEEFYRGLGMFIVTESNKWNWKLKLYHYC